MDNYWCDFGSMPVWRNQIQCYRIREHYRYPKSTQNTIDVVDAFNYPTKYKSKTESTNTMNKYNECKCLPIHNKHVYRPQTWESVINLYGDTDTTEVWDDSAEVPVSILESMQNDLYRKNKEDTATKKSKFKNISKNKGKRQKTKLNQQLLQYSKRNYIHTVPKTDERDLKLYPKPCISTLNKKNPKQAPKMFGFKFKKNPKSQRLREGGVECQGGDFCTPSECNNILEKRYDSENFNESVKKQELTEKNKGICTCKNIIINENIYSSYDLPSISNQKNIKDLLKGSVKQKKTHFLCKCKADSTKEEKKLKFHTFPNNNRYQSGDFCTPSMCVEIFENLLKSRGSPDTIDKNKKRYQHNIVCTCNTRKDNENVEAKSSFFMNKVINDLQKNNPKHKKNKTQCKCKSIDLPKENGNHQKGNTIQEKFKNILCECKTEKFPKDTISDTQKHIRKEKEDKSLCVCKSTELFEENANQQKNENKSRYQSGDFCIPSMCVKIFEHLLRSKGTPNTTNKKEEQYQNNIVCLCNTRKVTENDESKTNFLTNKVKNNIQKLNPKHKKNKTQCKCNSNFLSKENHQKDNTIPEGYGKEKFKINLCECKTKQFPEDIITDTQKDNRKQKKDKSLCECKSTKLFDENENQQKSENIQEIKTIDKNNTCICKTQRYSENVNSADVIKNYNKNEIVPNIRHGSIKHKKNISLCKCETTLPKNETSCEILQNCDCNFFSKLFSPRRKNSMKKRKEKTTKPLLEIKVNTTDMHVMNPSEINNKVRRLGSTKDVSSCVCMSRKKRIESQTCKSGVCKKARKQRNKRFTCKCEHETKKIECDDSTCDQIDVFRKFDSAKQSKNNSEDIKKINPLFDVILDKTNMNIVNSEEIVDIFKKASRHQCKRGVCRTAARKNMESNCKCIGKKIPKTIRECSNDTCNVSLFGSRMCNFCSRIFVKRSEDWIPPTQYLKNQNRNLRKKSTRSNTFHKQRKLKVGKKGKKQKMKRKKKLKEKCKECIAKLTNAKERERLQREQELAHMTQDERVQFYIQENRQNCEEKVKEKEDIYKIKDKKAEKQLETKIRKLIDERQKDGHHSTFLNDIISGPLNIAIRSIKQLFVSIYYLIADPVGSYVYVKEKVKHPVLTMERLKKWLVKTWLSKTVFLSSTVKDSRVLNILSDQIEDHPLFEKIIANSSRISAKEKARYERKAVMRKKRIQMRRDEALFGCRHIILTTLRKTPCLWIYSICPNLYPQCLGLIAFLKNFMNIIIFLIAIVCWTPCIITVELCRALLCCIVCTN